MGKRFLRSRKGEFSWLVATIIGAIVIVMITFLVYSFYVSYRERLEVSSCKDSIAAHSLLAGTTMGEVFSDIKCPIRYKTIDVKNEPKAKREIAEDMHRCWYEWQKGEGQLFKGEGVFCHICSIYDFKQKDRKVEGFVRYLASEDIQVKYIGDTPGISYQDYFQGYASPNSEADMRSFNDPAFNDQDYINTSGKYATIFVYASGKDWIDTALEGGGRTAAGAGGVGLVLLGTAGAGAEISAALGSIGTAASSTAATATYTITTVTAAGTTTAAGTGVVLAAGEAATAGGVAAGAGTVTATNFWNPVGWIAAAVVVGAGAYLIYESVTYEPEWVSFIVFRPYDEDSLSNLGCQRIATTQGSHSDANR